LILAVVALFGCASAFTVAPASRVTAARPAVSARQPPVSTSSTALPAIIVDPAIAEMTANSDPVGAFIMMMLAISIWELVTPGRARKEA